MAVPFGFSVGDFIATLGLIRDVVDALRESAGSSTTFQTLMRELYSLERAMLDVNGLQPSSPEMEARLSAIKQVAAQTQHPIDTFLHKNKKFQPTLRAGGSKDKWRDVLHKIQWRLYSEDDVAQLRATINAHTASITVLLVLFQIQSAEGMEARSAEQTRRISERLEHIHTTAKSQQDSWLSFTSLFRK
jgi:hypothetical protein